MTLRRAIKLLHATALVVGIIIGASIFVQPSEITREVPSVGGILAVWLAAGALTMIGALICAELSARYPESGGVYVFLRETLSPSLGFLWGWAMFWSMHTGIIAAVAVVLARYAGELVALSDAGTRMVAVATILLISAVNVFGVKQGSRLQTSFTIAKLGAIALLLFAGFAFGRHVALDTAPAQTHLHAGAFGRALAAGLFAFGGWHMVTYTAGETHDPQRVLPRALVLGVSIVVVCYVALNALYLYLLPLETVAASTRVAADAASAVIGSPGATLISTLVVFSAFGALAGLILAGPRVYYAMGHDHALFRWLGAVHPRYQTPHRAIMLQALWACVLVATGTYRALFTRVVYTEWIFFALLAVGLMRVRSHATSSFRLPEPLMLLRPNAAARRPRVQTGEAPPAPSMLLRPNAAARRPRVQTGEAPPAFPLLPVLFIVASLYVVIASVMAQPGDSAVGLGMVAVGLPVYYWLRKREQAGK